MGFLKKMFGTNESVEEKQLPWINLTGLKDLESIVERSKSKTQVVFKHSTRCGISKMVMNQFVDKYDLEANVDLYYLDLLSYRDVSNEVGFKFQVIHQSPQILVIKNGITVAHASHSAINDLDIKRFE